MAAIAVAVAVSVWDNTAVAELELWGPNLKLMPENVKGEDVVLATVVVPEPKEKAEVLGGTLAVGALNRLGNAEGLPNSPNPPEALLSAMKDGNREGTVGADEGFTGTLSRRSIPEAVPPEPVKGVLCILVTLSWGAFVTAAPNDTAVEPLVAGGTFCGRLTGITPIPASGSAESAAFTLGTEVLDRSLKPPPSSPSPVGPIRLRLSWPKVFRNSPCTLEGGRVVNWGRDPCKMADPSLLLEV